MSQKLAKLERLWNKDLSLWNGVQTDESIADRLGWLDSITWMQANLPALQIWADNLVAEKRFDTVLLLGMGGSSLAAVVFYSLFGDNPDYLKLEVLDTTSPTQISTLTLNLQRTLIIVSSKSGYTIETADLMAYFYARMAAMVNEPGSHFVAITDPGSSLAKQADNLVFLKVFFNPFNIGGRYSALSYFGLVPAVLTGVDLGKLLERTAKFALSTHNSDVGIDIINLAMQLSDIGSSGLTKLILKFDQPIAALGIWIEQLIAESTGKNGVGVIPVIGENNMGPEDKRVVVETQFGIKKQNAEKALRENILYMENEYDIGGEFLRWELVAALSASEMRLNPFDQPDVEEAKIKTREIVQENMCSGFEILKEYDALNIFYHQKSFTPFLLGDLKREISLKRLIKWYFQQQKPDYPAKSEYLAILAYLPMDDSESSILNAICTVLAKETGLTTTLGYGPRYLHSTGQLHKGGPAVGCFLQIIEEYMPPLPIPGREYGFDDLHRAQADGDFSVLAEKSLPILRISLKGDRLRALENLASELGAFEDNK